MTDLVNPYASLVERRYAHVLGDGVNRADARLRRFARRDGDAVFCRLCDGDGVVLATANRLTADPVKKCSRCGGEGLEPPR